MTGATVLMIAFIFLSFFGMTLGEQLAGQILCGIPWGCVPDCHGMYTHERYPLISLGSY